MGSLEDRFWAKVNKTDGCWLWTGATPFGYGVIQRGRRGEGVVRAPRLSWEWEYGPIPDGLIVCHSCDTPACVRPDHLFLGTQKDNSDDRDAKGRTQRYRAAWTHCIRGHEFDEKNTYIDPKGKRGCRICRNDAVYRSLERRLGQA